MFHGFSNSTNSGIRGRLMERTNRHYFTQGLTGETYLYDGRGMVNFVVTASPQAYSIHYSYHDTGPSVNKLHRIEVHDDSENLIAEAEYTYQETLTDVHNDVGEFGDLVQVKTSELQNDGNTWQERITQYRYYRTGSGDGIDHQLKMILNPDAVEHILAQNNLSSSEDIFTKSDSESLLSANSVSSYASRAFTYYASNLNTNNPVATP